jgi:hypothetical protein
MCVEKGDLSMALARTNARIDKGLHDARKIGPEFRPVVAEEKTQFVFAGPNRIKEHPTVMVHDD